MFRIKYINSQWLATAITSLLPVAVSAVEGELYSSQQSQMLDAMPLELQVRVDPGELDLLPAFSDARAYSIGETLRFVPIDDRPLSLDELMVEQNQSVAQGSFSLRPLEDFSPRLGGKLSYNEFGVPQDVLDQYSVKIGGVNDGYSEIRAETFMFGEWSPAISPEIGFEGGASVEYFELRDAGASGQNRGYTYIKPRLEVAYKDSSDQRWTLGVERSVGQSGLSDYVLAVNSSVDDIWRANPDIEPQTAWELQAQFEGQFADDLASIKLKAFYNHLEEVIDYVAVSDTDSAPGNIGDGYLRGVRLDTGVALWGGLVGNASMVYQQSEVTDPFLGVKRSLSNVSNQQLSLGLEKAFEMVPLKLGLNYLHQGDYKNQRHNQVNRISHSEGYLDSYLEWNLFKDFSMRLDVRNLLNNTMVTKSTNYNLSVKEGEISSTELYSNQAGRFWGVSMSSRI